MDGFWIATALWLAGLAHHVFALRVSERTRREARRVDAITAANIALKSCLREATALAEYGARDEAQKLVTEACADYDRAIAPYLETINMKR